MRKVICVFLLFSIAVLSVAKESAPSANFCCFSFKQEKLEKYFLHFSVNKKVNETLHFFSACKKKKKVRATEPRPFVLQVNYSLKIKRTKASRIPPIQRGYFIRLFYNNEKRGPPVV